MGTYCKILDSPFLGFGDAGQLCPDNKRIREAKDFFSSATLRGVRLVWEIRAPITQTAIDLMAGL